MTMSREDKKTYRRSPSPATDEVTLPETGIDASVNRRKFMQLAGFAVGGAALAGCSRGVEHGVMPYLIRPEEVTPGKPYWYASICGGCPAGCGVLAKARDGRPIKLEGNPEHPVSRGGLCAIGQASVLSLYDSLSLRAPLLRGTKSDWPAVDAEIERTLGEIRTSGGRVRFLTDSGTGPVERQQIGTFLARFDDGQHVTYDPISASAIIDAHHDTHNLDRIPRYHFDRAEVIVGVSADFLGGWLSPVEYTAAYQAGRKLDESSETFSYHVQLEARLSLTGSNADQRAVIPAGSEALVLGQLTKRVARLAGSSTSLGTLHSGPLPDETIDSLAQRLWRAPRGRTLVVSGVNDTAVQKLVNTLNELLGNYGPTAAETTIDVEAVSMQRSGSDAALRALLNELESGSVDALFIRGVNPLYDLPGGKRLADALGRVKLVVSFSDHIDETSQQATVVCPEPHYLASWGDAESIAGMVSVRQPALRPIGSTRPLLESLAVWSGTPRSAYEIVRESWRRTVYPRRIEGASFDEFWNKTLHDGFARVGLAAQAVTFKRPALQTPDTWHAPADGQLALELYPAPGMLDGRHAHNAWLYELPDPVAKTVWDNFAAISLTTASAAGLETGDVVTITAPDAADDSIELPVLVQPGQDDGTISISLGYGRQGTDRFAKVGPQWWEGQDTIGEGETIGVAAAPLLRWAGDSLSFSGRAVRMEKTGQRHVLTMTQQHHSLDIPAKLSMSGETRRPIVQEASLAAWKKDHHAGAHAHHDFATLWADHPKEPHHWGLAIDLSACTGCSACVIACQAENNVPVVGKDEVQRVREMHWMRIDRYYSGEGKDVDVVHMPMMCQHCDNAPCETVCPVQATGQTAEGLNQQVYNRCVGTRYCANNCPFKVRRFNWFDYPHEDPLQNLALNPEVTVRSRGVMEKCSLCVQRIQDGKAEAKRTGQPVQDGDIQPACVQSCPAKAIVFGDQNDEESQLSHQKHDPRHFTVLSELGVKPVVGYLTLIRNREET
jgi:Fe-S-cluster-containing dehydrogenase component